MQEAVIIGALRSPLGAYNGALSGVSAVELAGIVAGELVRRAGIPPADVGELVLGNVLSSGLGQNPARQAAARAGIPFSSSAYSIDMVCGSGLRAVCLAAQAVRLGQHEAVLAGGAENMSMAPHLLFKHGEGRRSVSALRHDGLRCAFSGELMGKTAERLARRFKVTRRQQDRYAFESHARARRCSLEGQFEREIVPVTRTENGGRVRVDRDECPRDGDLELLGRIRPAFGTGGTITAANATPFADGAAMVLVVSAAYARKHGIRPLARIAAHEISGVDPEDAFLAPVDVVRRLLDGRKLPLSEIDLFEIADSFAVEGLLCMDRLGLDAGKVNVRGGTLALGHPLGASGVRILVTLVHLLGDTGARRGVAAVCLGGGNAVAMLVENDAGP